jgi:hypothetical protein
MTRIFLAMALAGFAAAPVLAMDDMPCADFTAMDAAGQAETVAMMEEGMGAMAPAGGMMASTEAMSPEDTAMAVASTCAEHPDMMVGEAMKDMMGE